jgi:hypothetical protein
VRGGVISDEWTVCVQPPINVLQLSRCQERVDVSFVIEMVMVLPECMPGESCPVCGWVSIASYVCVYACVWFMHVCVCGAGWMDGQFVYLSIYKRTMADFGANRQYDRQRD